MVSKGVGKEGPHAMIARFHEYQDREAVWRKKSNLKNKPYFIEEDFPEEIREIRKQLIPAMYHARSLDKRANLSFDKLIVDDSVFTLERLQQLPSTHYLNLEKIATPKIGNNITAFFTSASPLSNHCPSKMVIDGVEYHSNEQFYLAQQARFFRDYLTMKKIMDAPSARECKYLNGNTKSANDLSKWFDNNVALDTMKRGLTEKFKQNRELQEFLLSTGDSKLAEANINDTYWAVGLALKQKDQLADQSKWKGKNILGKLLEEIREELKG